jgi:hypothetical protein
MSIQQDPKSHPTLNFMRQGRIVSTIARIPVMTVAMAAEATSQGTTSDKKQLINWASRDSNIMTML